MMSDNEGKNSIRDKIIFDPIKFGVAWHVRAIYPNNQVVEHITGLSRKPLPRSGLPAMMPRRGAARVVILMTKPFTTSRNRYRQHVE
jgi:hypothetical protein